MNSWSSEQDQYLVNRSDGLEITTPDNSDCSKEDRIIPYSSMTSFVFYNTTDGPYKQLLTDVISNIKTRHPTLSTKAVNALVGLSVFEHPDTKQELIDSINYLGIHLIEKNDAKNGEILLINVDKVADSLLNEKGTIDAIVKLLKDLEKQEENRLLQPTREVADLQWNLPNPYQPLQSTSEKTKDSVVAPIANQEQLGFREVYEHLMASNNSTKQMTTELFNGMNMLITDLMEKNQTLEREKAELHEIVQAEKVQKMECLRRISELEEQLAARR